MLSCTVKNLHPAQCHVCARLPHVPLFHRWGLSPISVISDIGLSLISELSILDCEGSGFFGKGSPS